VVKATLVADERGEEPAGPAPREPASDGNRERGVDFVVAGFGLGAVLMLVGFAVRDLGPLRYRSQADGDVAARQWSDLCRHVGTLIVTGGFAICLATLLLLSVGVGDDTGAVLVVLVAAAAVIGSGAGSMVTIRRYVEERVKRPPAYSVDGEIEAYGVAVQPFHPAADAARSVGEDETTIETVVPGEDEESERGRTVATAEKDRAAVTEETEQGTPPPLARTFESPLLKDVTAGAPAENGRGFRSSLLADLSASGGGEGGHGEAPSVPADLSSEREERTAEVFGPPAPAESRGAGTEDDAAKNEAGMGVTAEAEARTVEDAAEDEGETADETEVGVAGAPRTAP
jgi:hypothetical protein